MAVRLQNGSIARHRLLKNVPAVIQGPWVPSSLAESSDSTRLETKNRCNGEGQQNTHATTEELLYTSFSIRFVFYERRVVCHLFPQLHVIRVRLVLCPNCSMCRPTFGCDGVDHSEERT
jgi:hypothetical protein